MKIKILFPVLMLSILLGAWSCTEDFDVTLDDSFTRLVIDGSLTTDTTAHRIRLSSSTSYFYNEMPPAVSGASVWLDDGISQVQMLENPAGSGLYLTPADYFGVPGRAYQLQIDLLEPIGSSANYSAITKLPATSFKLDSIQLEYQSAFEFWSIKLFAWDPPTTDYYRLDASINGVLLTDTAYRTAISDDRFFNGNYTNGLSTIWLRDVEVQAGDTIELIMSAIDKNYYDFLFELQNESGFNNPLFGGPPANISSNLNDGGLGYFSARNTGRVSMVVTPELYNLLRK